MDHGASYYCETPAVPGKIDPSRAWTLTVNKVDDDLFAGKWKVHRMIVDAMRQKNKLKVKEQALPRLFSGFDLKYTGEGILVFKNSWVKKFIENIEAVFGTLNYNLNPVPSNATAKRVIAEMADNPEDADPNIVKWVRSGAGACIWVYRGGYCFLGFATLMLMVSMSRATEFHLNLMLHIAGHIKLISMFEPSIFIPYGDPTVPAQYRMIVRSDAGLNTLGDSSIYSYITTLQVKDMNGKIVEVPIDWATGKMKGTQLHIMLGEIEARNRAIIRALSKVLICEEIGIKFEEELL